MGHLLMMPPILSQPFNTVFVCLAGEQSRLCDTSSSSSTGTAVAAPSPHSILTPAPGPLASIIDGAHRLSMFQFVDDVDPVAFPFPPVRSAHN